MKFEAKVYNLMDHQTKKRPKGRTNRMPAVVQTAIALIKAAQAKALEAGLATNDGATAEGMRWYSQGLDDAARYVLHAFDETTKKPSL